MDGKAKKESKEKYAQQCSEVLFDVLNTRQYESI